MYPKLTVPFPSTHLNGLALFSDYRITKTSLHLIFKLVLEAPQMLAHLDMLQMLESA